MKLRVWVIVLVASVSACAIVDGLGGDGDDGDIGDPPEIEFLCLDGEDEDDDGQQDCEDDDCAGDGVCDGLVDCDGGPVPGSCHCLDDSGCDDFFNGSSFVCHFDPDFGSAGVCGPNCFDDDWCGQFGLICNSGGRCVSMDMPPGELCLDGTDNDGDGLQDCEDEECRGDFECQSTTFSMDVIADFCDGIDTGANPGFPAAQPMVDEGACRCVDDGGCDQINSQGGGNDTFVCHDGLDDSTCGPDCLAFPWCPPNAACIQGRCEAGGA